MGISGEGKKGKKLRERGRTYTHTHCLVKTENTQKLSQSRYLLPLMNQDSEWHLCIAILFIHKGNSCPTVIDYTLGLGG